jgi:hypothetical protein
MVDNGSAAGGEAEVSSASFGGCTVPFGTPATETADNLPPTGAATATRRCPAT